MHYTNLNEDEKMQSKLDDFFESKCNFFKCKKAVKFPNKCLRDVHPTLTMLRY